jgi:hypothetical protein
VLGDARVSLELEPPQDFDLLALDAFSGDAIPIHLLTREAFELYLRHLQPSGIIAVHISNKYLDLQPVVRNVADHFHLALAIIDSDEHADYEETDDGSAAAPEEAPVFTVRIAAPGKDPDWWLYSSMWVLLTRDPALLERPEIQRMALSVEGDAATIPLWTDDFASVFQVLRIFARS